MPAAAIILINGFPGVGKRGVAAELCKLLPNARFIDFYQLDMAADSLNQESERTDHLRYKLAGPCFITDPNLYQRETVLESIFATVASEACPTSATPPIYLVTDTVYTCRPTRSYQELYLGEATDHHLPLIHLIISCTTEANVARFMDGPRTHFKEHDESHVIENRMTYEIAHFVKPAKIGQGGAHGLEAVEGLAGEYEIDNTKIGLGQTASIFAEYIQDALRGAGWYFQLNRVRRIGK